MRFIILSFSLVKEFDTGNWKLFLQRCVFVILEEILDFELNYDGGFGFDLC